MNWPVLATGARKHFKLFVADDAMIFLETQSVKQVINAVCSLGLKVVMRWHGCSLNHLVQENKTDIIASVSKGQKSKIQKYS